MQMITAWEHDHNLRNGVVLNQLQYDVSQLVDPQTPAVRAPYVRQM
jgi:hypothetical protein